jgi:hypothetical protein
LDRVYTSPVPEPPQGRRPPRAYTQLLHTESEDARVHCAVLNVRPDTGHPTPPDPPSPRERRRYEMQTGPDTRATSTTGVSPDRARSLRTQQRAYDPVPRPTPVHAPRSEDHDAVLGAGPRPAAELVSVPPSSTTPHARRHPQMGTDHGVGAALDHFQRGKRPVLLRKERASTTPRLGNSRQGRHTLDRTPYNPPPATCAHLHRQGLG